MCGATIWSGPTQAAATTAVVAATTKVWKPQQQQPLTPCHNTTTLDSPCDLAAVLPLITHSADRPQPTHHQQQQQQRPSLFSLPQQQELDAGKRRVLEDELRDPSNFLG